MRVPCATSATSAVRVTRVLLRQRAPAIAIFIQPCRQGASILCIRKSYALLRV